MRKMPVISSDPELNDRVEKICAKMGDIFHPVFLSDSREALEYLMYELPEVNLINFSDPEIDSQAILDTIKSDPWLHYGGIIGVHNRQDLKGLEEQMPDSNVISLIPRGEFVSSFYRVLRILVQNRRIIFQRDLQSYLLGSIAGSFVMDNDPYNVKTYANLISNYLYNSNFINRDKRDRLHVALSEMLMNAVEHGNCDIDYEEKTAWLQEHGDILDLVREKCTDPEVREKRVNFSYRIIADRSYFTIRDEGEGFDWRSRLEPGEDVNLSLHGHGIQMTRYYIENLCYNDSGNEVQFELSHQHNESNMVPTIFREQEEHTFKDGETVFKEGEESNYLYYIVSGTFDIYASSRLISALTPDDIFIGEMSFLLNDRRSATVLSHGRSVVKPIPKKAFLNVIKEKPHYGIFLARLLAQRLSKLNATVAELKSSGS
ncbi:MAG: cyclic nucleotide-binding domain-containing protein [Spirochaetales bacterium]|nr:cyclic nucleotide-binding domain-containing protein [Spirochaetales bacterium]